MTEAIQEEETVERDLIDDLIDDLNDGVDGVIFDRDLIDTDRPGDWGAVFLSGEDDAEWADGNMVDQVLAIHVWACVSDRGSGVKRKVQTVLKAFCAENHTGWKFAGRTYAADLDNFEWHWVLELDGPLAEEAETGAAEPTDDTPAQQGE